MKYYVVTYTHTKLVRWALRSSSHVKYLHQLIDQGSLQVSGPLSVKRRRADLLIFMVENRPALDQLVAADPDSRHHLVAELTVHEWQLTTGSLGKPATGTEEMKYFVVTYDVADSASPADAREAQQQYLTDLYDKGQLRVGGYYPGTGTQHQGMYVLMASSLDQANEIAKTDPCHQLPGANYSVSEWDPRFGDFK